jgi:isopentenyl diphosphate isomerase/L-lactate dehydrogenase-like FMN-dependent dehydrogenase
VSLAATGGVHTALDGIKALLSGAHAVQMVSAILQRAPANPAYIERTGYLGVLQSWPRAVPVQGIVKLFPVE